MRQIKKVKIKLFFLAKEAKQIMVKAISEFTGTEEEVNVFIANSEISTQTGDIKKAISILKGVNSDSPYFA